MRYEIQFKSSAWRAFRKLRGEARGRLVEAIWSLADDPTPPGCRKLVGRRYFYRIRVGDYRIVYEVDTQAEQATIHYVRHRREVYRVL